jgi:hypothetical protein
MIQIQLALSAAKAGICFVGFMRGLNHRLPPTFPL